MKKNIKDYLHLYLGCQMERGGIVTGALLDAANESAFNAWEDFKPILRPLSDITNREKTEIYKMIFGREFPNSGQIFFRHDKTTSSDPRWILSTGVDRLGIEMDGTVWGDCDLNNKKHNQHLITLYLLKQRFDIFGLIEGGLAIDKTKLK